jgi:AraC-like DNA-binding protein
MPSELHVDPLSLLLFITLAQGLFVESLLVVRYQLRPVQHLYLFLLVASLMWLQAEFLSVRLPYDVGLPFFYGTRYGAWFIIGPLFYLYGRSVIGKPIASFIQIAVHVLPFLVFAVIIPILNQDLLSFRQVNYGMLTTFDPFNDSVSVGQYVFAGVFILQFVHAFAYSFAAYTLISRYQADVKQNYSSIPMNDFRWAKWVTVLFMVIIALISFFLILYFVRRSYNRDLDYLYVIPTSLLIYFVSYRLAGVSWPVNENRITSKYEKSSLTNTQAQAYAIRLEKLMRESKPYLQNELRLQELAEMVKVPPHHLSQVINDRLNSTFFDYINRYRVEEAKRLIVNEPESSLLEIAFKAGFNNKTSFTNAFRKFAFQTPNAFRKFSSR